MLEKDYTVEEISNIVGATEKEIERIKNKI